MSFLKRISREVRRTGRRIRKELKRTSIGRFAYKATKLALPFGDGSAINRVWENPYTRTIAISVASVYTGGLAAGLLGTTTALSGAAAGALGGAVGGAAAGAAGNALSGDSINSDTLLGDALTGVVSGAGAGVSKSAAAATRAPTATGVQPAATGVQPTGPALPSPGARSLPGIPELSGLSDGPALGFAGPSAAAAPASPGGGLLQTALRSVAEDPVGLLQIGGSALTALGDQSDDVERERIRAEEEAARRQRVLRFLEMFQQDAQQGRGFSQALGLESFRRTDSPFQGGIRGISYGSRT